MNLACARSSRETTLRTHSAPTRRSTRTHSVIFCEDHVGSNPMTTLLRSFSGGSGMDLASARSSRRTTPRTHSTPTPSLDSNPLCDLLRRSRGFEPHDHTASFLQRREWDSNPRGVATNALAGRRHKPLGHPSKRRPPSPEIAPLGIEPRLSGTRIRRVANYTTGHREPPVGFEPTTPSLRVTCSTN